MPETPVLERIRAATRTCHDALERDLDVIGRLAQAHSRLTLMHAYYTMYAAAEAALAPHLRALADLQFERRRKAATLLRDIEALGTLHEENAEIAAPLPPIPSTAHAIGFAYVLEGASLGGRVIRKRAATAGIRLEGLRFFDVYGEETAQKWKEFCAVLERECAAEPQEAVSGAMNGFSYARAALVERTTSS